jgi:hypothetical protein
MGKKEKCIWGGRYEERMVNKYKGAVDKNNFS